ncbi:hypothetical protein DPMN_054059 [Dreissena polymorpha]|uniref:Uncharacterized protein n=1 Tax=Dreissena polymorpha TaxID=45954 RepID=A0A9D4HPD9_DREPO|nr:hypothetical protein DPMN_054059 [Dreissena polymorpha]
MKTTQKRYVCCKRIMVEVMRLYACTDECRVVYALRNGTTSFSVFFNNEDMKTFWK